VLSCKGCAYGDGDATRQITANAFRISAIGEIPRFLRYTAGQLLAGSIVLNQNGRKVAWQQPSAAAEP
jgi:hypothetical protein